MKITSQLYGKSPEGEDVYSFTLTNSHGMSARITNYGAILTHLFVPDKNGVSEDIVLGFDEISRYFEPHPAFGATIGRFANRIAYGKYTAGSHPVQLSVNHGSHHLHGGANGFSLRTWGVKESGEKLTLLLLSPHGDQGYPGDLQAEVSFEVTEDNQLLINFSAASTKDTPVNFTHHSYFNLGGHKTGNVLNHVLSIQADKVLDVDHELIPTGKLNDVKGHLDLRKPVQLFDHKPENAFYDHCFALNTANIQSGKAVASAYHAQSGRFMQVYTTQPGLQIYVPSDFNPKVSGKQNFTYGEFPAFCMETQHFPDSPNHPNFPNTLLKAGETYAEQVSYAFSIK